MSKANADNVKLSYIKETIAGTTPTDRTRTPLRFTSDSLNDTATFENSKEITGNRRVKGGRISGKSAGGTVNCELSCKSYEDLLLALCMSSGWSAESNLSEGETITIDKDANVITDVDGDGLFDALVVGDWLIVDGGATNSKIPCRVTAVDTVADTVTVFPMVELTSVTGSTSVDIYVPAKIIDGSTEHSFSIQKQYSDLGNVFEIYRGMRVSQGSISIPATGSITNTFEFMGIEEEDTTTSVGTGVEDDFTTESLKDTDLLGVFVDSDLFEISTLQANINNNLRERPIAGEIYNKSVGIGKFNVTGTVEAYFENQAAVAHFKAVTSFPVAIAVKDPDGNILIIDIPKVKFTTRDKQASGENTDVMLSLGFAAYEQSNATIRVYKFEPTV